MFILWKILAHYNHDEMNPSFKELVKKELYSCRISDGFAAKLMV